MATVRIYKVAELLQTTSQEVLALLKRDHGIELKSASSTLEEVVAKLRAAGFRSAAELVTAGVEQVATSADLDLDTAEAVMASAQAQAPQPEPDIAVEEAKES